MNKNRDKVFKTCEKHVHTQFCQGGGILFKQTAAQCKPFLNVSWETPGEGATDPEDYLGKQSAVWSKFRNPKIVDLDHRLAAGFQHSQKAAAEQNISNPIEDEVQGLDYALSGFKKDTSGSDVWKHSELREL